MNLGIFEAIGTRFIRYLEQFIVVPTPWRKEHVDLDDVHPRHVNLFEVFHRLSRILRHAIISVGICKIASTFVQKPHRIIELWATRIRLMDIEQHFCLVQAGLCHIEFVLIRLNRADKYRQIDLGIEFIGLFVLFECLFSQSHGIVELTMSQLDLRQ